VPLQKSTPARRAKKFPGKLKFGSQFFFVFTPAVFCSMEPVKRRSDRLITPNLEFLSWLAVPREICGKKQETARQWAIYVFVAMSGNLRGELPKWE
jgi:hypothetical protein